VSARAAVVRVVLETRAPQDELDADDVPELDPEPEPDPEVDPEPEPDPLLAPESDPVPACVSLAASLSSDDSGVASLAVDDSVDASFDGGVPVSIAVESSRDASICPVSLPASPRVTSALASWCTVLEPSVPASFVLSGANPASDVLGPHADAPRMQRATPWPFVSALQLSPDMRSLRALSVFPKGTVRLPR